MPKKTQNKKKIVQSKSSSAAKPGLKKKSIVAKKVAAKKSSASVSTKQKGATKPTKNSAKPLKTKVAAKSVKKAVKPASGKSAAKFVAKPTKKPAAKSSSAKSSVASKVKTASSKTSATKSSPAKLAAVKPEKAAKPTTTVQSKPLSGKSGEPKSFEPRQTVSNDDVAHFRSILLQKRRRLMGDVAMMSEEALGSEEGAVDNHAPIHPAEVGSHSFEQEFTLDLLSHDGDRIQMIEMALEKIDEGTYGQCDECGARIPKGRLEMLPESIYCVKCASKMEGSRF
jgi:DnaK suppressor protein